MTANAYTRRGRNYTAKTAQLCKGGGIAQNICGA